MNHPECFPYACQCSPVPRLLTGEHPGSPLVSGELHFFRHYDAWYCPAELFARQERVSPWSRIKRLSRCVRTAAGDACLYWRYTATGTTPSAADAQQRQLPPIAARKHLSSGTLACLNRTEQRLLRRPGVSQAVTPAARTKKMHCPSSSLQRDASQQYLMLWTPELLRR